MNILHIISGELCEGAALGATTLHRELLKNDYLSFILSNSKKDYGIKNCILINQNRIFTKLFNIFDGIKTKRYYKRKKLIFSSGNVGFNFTHTAIYKSADIIHLHWVNGLLNLKTLSKIDKPIVWTIRDTWPFTGGCHVAQYFDCTRYTSGCGKCIQLNSNGENDLSSANISRKINMYPKNIKIVGISKWITRAAKKSQIFGEYDIKCIYNSIDTNFFKPIDKNVVRKQLNIPTNYNIIAFGTSNFLDIYKGAHLFFKAIKNLSAKRYFLITFGKNANVYTRKCHLNHINFGFDSDQSIIAKIYNSADLFVSSSAAESFGKTVAESMSCGTPVVCRNTMGLNEIVDHGINGFLYNRDEPSTLTKTIEKYFSLNNLNKVDFSIKSRHKIIQSFCSKKILYEYQKVYLETINNFTS